MFTKAFFFLGLLFLILPLGAFASPVACAEPATRCSCTDDEGNNTSSPDTSLRDGDSCAAYCDSIGSVSYSFFCDGDGTPEDSGEISDYLDRIAALVGIETITKEDPAIPALNVPIPGLDLSNSVQTDAQGNITTNMIGLYVNAVFTYGITLAALFGVLMLTIAGFQYMTAGGDKTAVTKAKGRMQNVLFGLVLLMASFAIAFLIDPRFTRFSALELSVVEKIPFDNIVEFGEGIAPSGDLFGVSAWQDCMLATFGKTDAEVQEQLVPVSFDGKTYYVHKLVETDFSRAFEQIEALNSSYGITSIGIQNWRANANNSRVLSFHAWGVAMDINPSTNPNCPRGETCTYDIPLEIVNIFRQNNFSWGGDWTSVKDYMHFSTNKFCGGGR